MYLCGAGSVPLAVEKPIAADDFVGLTLWYDAEDKTKCAGAGLPPPPTASWVRISLLIYGAQRSLRPAMLARLHAQEFLRDHGYLLLEPLRHRLLVAQDLLADCGRLLVADRLGRRQQRCIGCDLEVLGGVVGQRVLDHLILGHAGGDAL